MHSVYGLKCHGNHTEYASNSKPTAIHQQPSRQLEQQHNSHYLEYHSNQIPKQTPGLPWQLLSNRGMQGWASELFDIRNFYICCPLYYLFIVCLEVHLTLKQCQPTKCHVAHLWEYTSNSLATTQKLFNNLAGSWNCSTIATMQNTTAATCQHLGTHLEDHSNLLSNTPANKLQLVHTGLSLWLFLFVLMSTFLQFIRNACVQFAAAQRL